MCGKCIFFKNGDCNYEVKFPDSRYARGYGLKKTMREHDGRNCPCFETKLTRQLFGE